MKNSLRVLISTMLKASVKFISLVHLKIGGFILMDNNEFENDEFYIAYCIEGSAKYTDQNPPKDDEKGIWENLSEIRKIFQKYPCHRLETPPI